MSFDPRVTLARPDLADADLEGVVRAERFAAPTPMRLATPWAAIRTEPERSAEQADQILFGERFDVLDMRGDYAWGQAARDGYVGFVESAALWTQQPDPTHWVSALRAYAFEQPSIKTRAAGPFSLNALVAVEAEEGDFLRGAGAGWFHKRQLSPLGQEARTDYVAVAETFVGTPYLWGGRDSLGVDCSGLVQQALYACGRACPRDTDMQMALGEAAPPHALQRGDLVFWRGHVGIMLDGEQLLHANAFHMATHSEPLSEAVARIGASRVGQPIAYRRL